MLRILGKDTKTEIFVRKLCHFLELRFRLYNKSLPSNLSLIFKRNNIVILVHSCFWYIHNCKYEEVVPKKYSILAEEMT